MSIYRGLGGVNRDIKEITRGFSGVNRDIKEVIRGYSGVNRSLFSSAQPVIYTMSIAGSYSTGTVNSYPWTDTVAGNYLLSLAASIQGDQYATYASIDGINIYTNGGGMTHNNIYNGQVLAFNYQADRYLFCPITVGGGHSEWDGGYDEEGNPTETWYPATAYVEITAILTRY